jgi:regulator of replication initiation timing
MKKIIFSTLLASTTLFGLERPVLSRNCPPLSDEIKEITVLDNDAQLKELPADNAKKGPPILANNKLKIDLNRNVDQTESCYYPVTKGNNSYWIKQSGIKELIESSYKDTIKENRDLKAENQKLKSKLESLSAASEIANMLSNSFLITFLSALSVVGLLQRKNISEALQSIIKFSTQTDKFLEKVQTFIQRNSEFHVQNTELTSKLHETLDKFIPLLKQEPQIDPKNNQIEILIHQLIEERQLNVQILKEHLQVLRSLQDTGTDPNPPEPQPKPNPPEPQPKPNPPQPPPVPALPIFVTKVIQDEFYLNVIAKFNAEETEWLKSQINAKKLTPVTISQTSARGEYEDGEKITKLERDDNGTLLIFEAANCSWLIPNRTVKSWKRAVTESCFTHPDKDNLEEPAEVVTIENDNKLWKIKTKGKFK